MPGILRGVLALAAWLCVLLPVAHAQAPVAVPAAPAAPNAVVARIGYINMEKVFGEYYKTKQADSRLREQRDVARKFVADKQQQIKELQQKIESLTNDTNDVLLSPAALAERREQMATLRQEFQYRVDELDSFTNDKMSQLVARFEEERAGILNEVLAKVRDMAAELKLQVVLDLSGKTQSGLPTVFFYTNGTDLTAPVLAVLNAGQPPPATPAPTPATSPAAPALTPRK